MQMDIIKLIFAKQFSMQTIECIISNGNECKFANYCNNINFHCECTKIDAMDYQKAQASINNANAFKLMFSVIIASANGNGDCH